MAKSGNKKKKVIVTTSREKKDKLQATKSRASKSADRTPSHQLIFGRENYKWMLIGVALIGLGMLLMIGGYNVNPEIWDENGIYGFRRTVLAPMVILSGLAVEIYAIFK